MMKHSDQPLWYIIHTYTGHEDVVEESLRNMIENNKLQDQIFDIKVLKREEIVEKEDGKRKVVLKNIYPSYVFIKMIYSNQVWYYVTSTNGVTGFVGPQGRPMPLTPEEVKKNGLEAIKIEDFNIKVGDNVEIISGALAGFVGTVDEIHADREKVKVTVPMFGRLTPVEVEFSNVEKVK